MARSDRYPHDCQTAPPTHNDGPTVDAHTRNRTWTLGSPPPAKSGPPKQPGNNTTTVSPESIIGALTHRVPRCPHLQTGTTAVATIVVFRTMTFHYGVPPRRSGTLKCSRLRARRRHPSHRQNQRCRGPGRDRNRVKDRRTRFQVHRHLTATIARPRAVDNDTLAAAGALTLLHRRPAPGDARRRHAAGRSPHPERRPTRLFPPRPRRSPHDNQAAVGRTHRCAFGARHRRRSRRRTYDTEAPFDIGTECETGALASGFAAAGALTLLHRRSVPGDARRRRAAGRAPHAERRPKRLIQSDPTGRRPVLKPPSVARAAARLGHDTVAQVHRRNRRCRGLDRHRHRVQNRSTGFRVRRHLTATNARLRAVDNDTLAAARELTLLHRLPTPGDARRRHAAGRSAHPERRPTWLIPTRSNRSRPGPRAAVGHTCRRAPTTPVPSRYTLASTTDGQRLRSSSPFVGIVTEDERWEVIARLPPPPPIRAITREDVDDELVKRILEGGARIGNDNE